MNTYWIKKINTGCIRDGARARKIDSSVGSGVSRILFWGGGQNIFVKVGVFAWRKAPCMCFIVINFITLPCSYVCQIFLV